MNEKLLAELKKQDPARLTSEMVRIKSYSFMENQEDEISQYIMDFFLERNIRAYRTEIVPGRFNVFAVLEGTDRENSPSLMLTGHMDTVPAYDFEDAFSGRIAEEADGRKYVYGRGSNDMKGPLAAMMCAMAAIKDSGIKLKGDLVFCGVADEEEEGIGTAALIKSGPITDAAVIGEPNSLEIALGHKGLEWIEIEFEGKKVHGGSQKTGVNAIMSAGKFIHKLESYLPELAKRTHPVLGEATLNIGTIQGGDQPSTVPDKCVIRLDRRCNIGETIEQVYEELEAICEEIRREDPTFKAEVRDVFGGKTLRHVPFCTEKDDPLVLAAIKAEENAGVSPVLTAFRAWTDAGFMNHYTSCHCIIMGPGELALAHSIHEKISVEELETAARIYADMAVDYCGVQE